ncbi:MAG: DUF87 domain-containing protein [Bacteroidales bacterium]|nr:DUF87 domain-containing protein [Bacteroidales bacterium]
MNPISDNKEPEKKNIYKDNDISQCHEKAFNAMKLVDDIVLKKYLVKLNVYEIEPFQNKYPNFEDIVLFKIKKMSYDKLENTTDKFISVVSSMNVSDCTIALIIDGNKNKTDFYLGIKSHDGERPTLWSKSLKKSIEGNFPGSILEDISIKKIGEPESQGVKLLKSFSNKIRSVSSFVGVPSEKNNNTFLSNENYVQGLEKFINGMQNSHYRAIIIAQNNKSHIIQNFRTQYEDLYTNLSAIASQQISYSTNESLAEAICRTQSKSLTFTNTSTDGIITTKGNTTGKNDTTSTTHTDSRSKNNSLSSSIFKSVSESIFGAVNVAIPVLSFLTSSIGKSRTDNEGFSLGVSSSKAKSESDSTGVSHTVSQSISESKGTSHSESTSQTKGESCSNSFGVTTTNGSTKTFTMNINNKHIEEILKRIEKHLQRLTYSESSGLWSTSTYFMTYNLDNSSESIASFFRSIMIGENSSVETSEITTWNTDKETIATIAKYITSLSHPIVKYKEDELETSIMPISYLSSKEVAMLLGLPRKSVLGLPVVEHISLAKEVVKFNGSESKNKLILGNIFDQGIEKDESPVYLDLDSLCSHTLITGITGCGKSNTIYHLINQIRQQKKSPKFLIIEPAKGEYKDVFGNDNIYGTNPLKTPLLRINPFKFSEGVHVLEHIDKLIEIFNVCWPMYAVMPVILKESILKAYENCGWNLYDSQNKYSKDLFPTFEDLINELENTINKSAYSEEVKNNYQGALVTRVKSLTVGFYKEIFSSDEIGDKKLFDENVIVELSRIGSQETKSLIMGILIMRLCEYRANSEIEHNSSLRHITIIEEAHHILKKCSQEQNIEGCNVLGKSVEMLSNAIAEMRTFGEGFMIVDQSPEAIDISAIRNTNTKIIMRLPEEYDRMVAGKSVTMKDFQIDEIAKLPTGVAVVYQNDWLGPVLCKICEFKEERISFKMNNVEDNFSNEIDIISEIIKLLLKNRVNEPCAPNISLIKIYLNQTRLSTKTKISIFNAIEEYESHGIISISLDDNFELLSELISDIVNKNIEVKNIVKTVNDFNNLTQKLFSLIKSIINNLPENYYKELAHCLICTNVNDKKIYSGWIQYIETINY